MCRAAVVKWRRRYDDFPVRVGGTEVQPLFDRSAVVAWLLAHDKIGVPVAMPAGSYRGEGKTDVKDAAVIADQVRICRELHPLRAGDETVADLEIHTGRMTM